MRRIDQQELKVLGVWESEGGRSPTVTSVSDLRVTCWLSTTVPQLSETWRVSRVCSQMVMEHVVFCVGAFSRRIASLAIVSCRTRQEYCGPTHDVRSL